MNQPIPRSWPTGIAGAYLRNRAPALGLGVHSLEAAVQYLAARRRICLPACVCHVGLGAALSFRQVISLPAHCLDAIVRVVLSSTVPGGVASVTVTSTYDATGQHQDIPVETTGYVRAQLGVGLRASTAAAAPGTTEILLVASSSGGAITLVSWRVEIMPCEEITL